MSCSVSVSAHIDKRKTVTQISQTQVLFFLFIRDAVI